MVAPLKDLLVDLNRSYKLEVDTGVSTQTGASLLCCCSCWLELAGRKVCCINDFFECAFCIWGGRCQLVSTTKQKSTYTKTTISYCNILQSEDSPTRITALTPMVVVSVLALRVVWLSPTLTSAPTVSLARMYGLMSGRLQCRVMLWYTFGWFQCQKWHHFHSKVVSLLLCQWHFKTKEKYKCAKASTHLIFQWLFKAFFQ